MSTPRDVMAERFDKMRGELRSYDVADAFLTALDVAGFVLVASHCKICGDPTDLWCHNHGPLKDDGTGFEETNGLLGPSNASKLVRHIDGEVAP